MLSRTLAVSILKLTLKGTCKRSSFTTTVKMQDSRPPDHRQRRMRDHLKLMNYTMTVDEAKLEATVRTKGLHYTDFDPKSGMPKPWQLMKLLESARFYSHNMPLDSTGHTFRDYGEMTSDRMMFLATSCFDIDREMYDVSKPKSPLDVKIKGGYIGNTSLNSVATVLTENGHTLLRNVNQDVSIDKSTRRPMQLPEWWTEKYADFGKQTPALKFHKYDKPKGLTSFKVHVTRSDLDSYNHVNWTCYVRFALDGLYHHAKHGLVKNFDDLEKRGLKHMELLYSGESVDDDVLDVFVWSDAEDKNKVCVHVEKLAQFIFQGTFIYYDEPLY